MPGLWDADETETSASVLLPPANRQRVMIRGGGAVGDSDRATARTEMVAPASRVPRWLPGPDMPAPTRYPDVVILPGDTTLVTGGSRGYRARDDSAERVALLLDRSGATMRRVADPRIRGSYHSSALLLPDRGVLTACGDRLGSVTHTTDLEQRSVALAVRATGRASRRSPAGSACPRSPASPHRPCGRW